MIRGKATLDQGRKVVTIYANNNWQGTWSGKNGVTCRNAASEFAKDGWHVVPGTKWKVSPFDNGHVIDVIKDN